MNIARISARHWQARLRSVTKSFVMFPCRERAGALVLAGLTAMATVMAHAGQSWYVDNQMTGSFNGSGDAIGIYNPAARQAGTGTNTAYNTLAEAAAVAQPGDTVWVRGGTYREALTPSRSGTPDAYISYRAYTHEQPQITEPAGGTLVPALVLSERSYVLIEGLTFTNVTRWMYALNANYNIIRSNRFLRAYDSGNSSKAGLFFQEAMYNRIIGNVINDITSDGLALHKSDRNLIEGNTMTRAGHTLWTVKGGNYNVFRNNYFHNAIQKIGEIYDMDGAGFDHQFTQTDCTKHNLVDGNVFAYTASSGNASPYAGIQYAGQNGVIRRNRFYETVGPALDLTLYSSEAMYTYSNRVYNNVFSRTDFAGISLAGSASFTFYDNVMKNNILTRSIFVANDTRWSWYTGELSGQPVQFMTGRLNGFLFENNVLFHQNAGQSYLITYGTRDGANPPQHSVAWWHTNYPALFRGNLEYDPLFMDETNHNFRLKANTPLSDRGTFLTSAVGAGTGVVLRVQDAGYFYDGYGIPLEQGDLIQMEGSTTRARIAAIAYSNNVLTLETPLTWTNGQRVGLSYSGVAPEPGPYELEYVTLTVISAHGGAWPGSVTTNSGTTLSAMITNSPLYAGEQATQYVCVGVAVAGNAYTSLASTNVTLTLTNNATLTWIWTTNYWITLSNSGPGTVSFTNGWLAASLRTNVTAQSSNYYHFVTWTGTVNSVSNPLSLTINQAHALTALFVQNLATNGTPEWWLAQYGWTNNFNVAETNDADGDRLLTWQEWVAGTDPTHPLSVLAVTNLTWGGSGVVLRWVSASNRIYAVERTTNLTPASFAGILTNLAATPPVNVHTDQVPVPDKAFYRINVSSGHRE